MKSILLTAILFVSTTATAATERGSCAENLVKIAKIWGKNPAFAESVKKINTSSIERVTSLYGQTLGGYVNTVLLEDKSDGATTDIRILLVGVDFRASTVIGVKRYCGFNSDSNVKYHVVKKDGSFVQVLE